MSVREDQDGFGEWAAELAGLAAALLGWRPEEFWSATPAELASSLGQTEQIAEHMDREVVDRLRAQFPDDRGC